MMLAVWAVGFSASAVVGRRATMPVCPSKNPAAAFLRRRSASSTIQQRVRPAVPFETVRRSSGRAIRPRTGVR